MLWQEQCFLNGNKPHHTKYKRNTWKKVEKITTETKKKKDLYNYSYLIVTLCTRVKEGEWSVSSMDKQEHATGLRRFKCGPRLVALKRVFFYLNDWVWSSWLKPFHIPESWTGRKNMTTQKTCRRCRVNLVKTRSVQVRYIIVTMLWLETCLKITALTLLMAVRIW